MILLALIVVLLAGGLLAWIAERRDPRLPQWLAGAALLIDAALVGKLWLGYPEALTLTGGDPWAARLTLDWIPRFGIGFDLALDGLSLLLVALTVFLGLMAVAASWTEIRAHTGFFYFNLLWTLAGVVGVFLAVDLFLFFVFWEVMLVPMYFLIGLWGHEHARTAAIKFFLFTQGSGLLMLVAILMLVLGHYAASGVLTFGYFDLLAATLDETLAFWAMLGFLVAFAVKLPVVPLHTWLPDAHTEAPTGGSVILAGILLKTGAYGLLRFAVPLFPDAAVRFAPYALALGVLGILYGALLAFAQTDFKRLVAYSSVSHMGFVLLGVYAWNIQALQGAVMQIIAHGISTAALFMLAGALQERLHTRAMDRMGGLWAAAPRMGAIGMLFAVASLGLPGLGNFVGEFLVLLGTFEAYPAFAVLAVLGIIAAAIYALALVQRTFHGPPRAPTGMSDYTPRETAVMAVLVVIIVWLGLFPQPVLDMAAPALYGFGAAGQGPIALMGAQR